MFNAIARIVQIGLGVGLGIIFGNKVITSTTKENNNIICKVKEKIHKMTSPNSNTSNNNTK